MEYSLENRLLAFTNIAKKCLKKKYNLSDTEVEAPEYLSEMNKFVNFLIDSDDAALRRQEKRARDRARFFEAIKKIQTKGE